MKPIVHLIWLGNKIREHEIDSARGLIYAAVSKKAKVHFYVDSFSEGSVQSLVHGTLQSKEQITKYGELYHYDFLNNNQVKVINIDTDLKTYLQALMDLPNFKKELEKVFPKYQEKDVVLLLELMIKLELTGAGKNYAAGSDLLRTIVLLGQGGYYADLDIQLNRTWPRQEFVGELNAPNCFKINLSPAESTVNNDIIACPIDDPIYIKLLISFIQKYFRYLAADSRFLRKEQSTTTNRLVDYIAKNYLSEFSIKRIKNRYEETHKVTGTNAISNFIVTNNLFTKEHDFNGTLFHNARSKSTLSWAKKNRAEDDSRYRYSETKPERAPSNNSFVLFLLNNFDEYQVITFYAIYSLQNDLNKIAHLQKLDKEKITEIISNELTTIRNGSRPGFAEHFNKKAIYPGTREVIKLILGIYALRIHSETDVINQGASNHLFEILAHIDHEVMNKVEDKANYEVQAGHKFKALLHWCGLRNSLSDASFDQGFLSLGIFSKKYGTLVYILITQLNELRCSIDDRILSKLRNDQINAALRSACYYAQDARIITKILEFSAALAIDVDEKSTNGNTPIDWLKINEHLKDEEKQNIEMHIRSLSKNQHIRNKI